MPSDVWELNTLEFSSGKVWLGGRGDAGAIVLSSADGGATWVEVALQMSTISALTAFDSTIMAVGSTGAPYVGAMGTEGAITVSRDNGKIFRRVSGLGDLTLATNAVLLNSQQAYVGGYFSSNGHVENGTAILFQTSDSGVSWNRLPLPAGAVKIVDLLFLSTERGYGIIDAIQPIQRKSDGTLTWGQPVSLIPKPELGVSYLFASDDGVIYAVGTGGLYRVKP